jgi:hypothetical protein
MSELSPSSDHQLPAANNLPHGTDNIVQVGKVRPEAPTYADVMPLPAQNRNLIPPPRGRVAAPPINENNHQITDTDTVSVVPGETKSNKERPVISPRVAYMIGPLVSDTTLEERHDGSDGNPKWPAVKLHIHYGGHNKPENLRRANKIIQKADVYTCEQPETRARAELLAEAAQTDLGDNPKVAIEELIDESRTIHGKPVRGRFTEGQLRAVAGTGIAIGHFDQILPQESEDGISLSNLDKHLDQMLTLHPTLDECLDHINNSVREIIRLQTARDTPVLGPVEDKESGAITAGNFEAEVGRLLQDNPHLQQKEDITIVDTHGAMHTNLFHQARAAGVDVKRSFEYSPFVYPAVYQARRIVQIGKEPSRELLVQAFTEMILESTLSNYGVTYSGQATLEYTREVSGSLDEADAQALHDYIINNQVPSGEDMVNAFNARLQAKNLAGVLTDSADIEAWSEQRKDARIQKIAQLKADTERRWSQDTE